MKQFMLCTLVCLFGFSLHAQDRLIDNFVNKYKGDENVTHLNINGNLLNFLSEAEDDDGDRKFISKLEGISVFSIPNPSTSVSEDLASLRQGIQANNFEELIRVRDGKELIHIFLQETKDQIIRELIVLVQGSDEITLVSLSGEMYYEDLQQIKLDGNLQDALEHLPDEHDPRP